MTSVGQCFAHQERAHTPGDPVRLIVIAGGIPPVLKAANLTSTFDPNRPRQRPTQADTPRRGSLDNPRLAGHSPT
jgi:hypothetical protein